MLIGEYQNKLDQKGRLALPARWRSEFVTGGVVTRGLDGCLFVYTATAWSELLARLQQLSVTTAHARALSRHLIAGAIEFQLDKQGRLLLPHYLRQAINLTTECVIAGLVDRLEIWSAGAWQSYQASNQATVAELAESLTM